MRHARGLDDAAAQLRQAERAWVAANPPPGSEDGEVAKRYTQSPQKRPSESSCGFESHLPQMTDVVAISARVVPHRPADLGRDGAGRGERALFLGVANDGAWIARAVEIGVDVTVIGVDDAAIARLESAARARCAAARR